MNYIHELIDICNRDELKYFDQSLVVLEAVSVSTCATSSDSYATFFQENKVSRIIAVERPKDGAQLYVADGLSTKYHFSCPTKMLPSLVGAIHQNNNKDVILLFVPRSTTFFNKECMTVLNNVSIPSIFQNEDAKLIYDSVIKTGEKVASNSLAISGKRSNYSFSVGLQTMYAHKQHCARYCMLPHSKPHVPDVKKYPRILSESIFTVYHHVMSQLQRKFDNKPHPFEIKDSNGFDNVEVTERLQLRNEFLSYFKNQGNEGDISLGTCDRMFEACTVQPTAALGFHQDRMNCDYMDKTIAMIVPTTATTTERKNNSNSCLTYLFYTRKCVGQYARKISDINNFITDPSQCDLTRFCLKSLMNVGGVFDYQASLFEAQESLNDIGNRLENNVDNMCADVKEFCGLQCFKHGAAFDKMGYYSIFVNVFLCLYYQGMVASIDDSISLCMFFGLVCNGTSSLAAVWSSIYENNDLVLKWLRKRHNHTKLFDCLMKMYRKRFSTVGNKKKDDKVLYGNSKLPRYQYSNYSSNIMENSESVHNKIKLFLEWRDTSGKSKKESKQHTYLFNKLKEIKGIGPLSFNQLWHSLCLCGILPVGYIQSCIVAPASGPAKLLMTFFPSIKKQDLQMKKVADVKNALSKLGFKKVTEFFIENMMCECWRIVAMKGFFMKNMTLGDKCEVLLSSNVQQSIKDSKPTRYPDLYFRNPYTGDYQHLFRVVDKELLMRPSFMPNVATGSVNLHCDIQCNRTTGDIKVVWKGDLLKKMDRDTAELFA